jgi:hypothetical protein
MQFDRATFAGAAGLGWCGGGRLGFRDQIMKALAVGHDTAVQMIDT